MFQMRNKEVLLLGILVGTPIEGDLGGMGLVVKRHWGVNPGWGS